MTNQMDNKEIKFPGDYLTPEQREQERWMTMASCSVAMMTAKNAGERIVCVEAILDKFRDVPDEQPNRQDTTAYARFAAKVLLEALTKPEATQETKLVATENVFNEWIDAWLPSSTKMTLPRM